MFCVLFFVSLVDMDVESVEDSSSSSSSSVFTNHTHTTSSINSRNDKSSNHRKNAEHHDSDCITYLPHHMRDTDMGVFGLVESAFNPVKESDHELSLDFEEHVNHTHLF